jgi:hypothetical protein
MFDVAIEEKGREPQQKSDHRGTAKHPTQLK